MNDQKPADEAVITYADFVLICQVEDEEDFGGFVVKPDGVYVKAFDKHLLALLSTEERHELLWHPTGRYDEPALPLPCSLPELRSFEDESGLAGSIDEDLLAEVLAAKRKNHTKQPTRPAPEVTPADDDKEDDSLTPAERRAKHDITSERGCRRLILEHWDTIELRYGPKPDGHQVLRVLLKEKDESQRAPTLKGVRNRLTVLRREKLIP